MSMLIRENGLLFHHIPRTGGTTVKQVYRHLGIGYVLAARKHTPIGRYRRKHLDRIRRIYTIVRNPWDYYASTWKWLQRTGIRGRLWVQNELWHPHRTAAGLWCDRFETWVNRVVNSYPGYLSSMYTQYCGIEGDEFCWYIARTRTLNTDIALLLRAIGLPLNGFNPPKANAIPCDVPWTPRLRETIADAEQDCIRRFFTGENTHRRFYCPLEDVHEVIYEQRRQLRKTRCNDGLRRGGAGVEPAADD